MRTLSIKPSIVFSHRESSYDCIYITNTVDSLVKGDADVTAQFYFPISVFPRLQCSVRRNICSTFGRVIRSNWCIGPFRLHEFSERIRGDNISSVQH